LIHSTRPRVVITGMGVVSPCGHSLDTFFANLTNAASGVSRMNTLDVPADLNLVAAQVSALPGPRTADRQFLQLDRATQFALVAADQAIADAALALTDEESMLAGVYWGTGLGGASSIEEGYRAIFATERKRLRPTSVVLGMSNAAAAHVSIAHRLRGPQLNISTACSSSASAIGEAYRAIRHGYADVIVAGGSEALLTFGNLSAWSALQALARTDSADPSRTCKPFAADRSGLVLGEGAAALVLESVEHATRRGARVHATITGYGNVGDASSMSRPDAQGQARAMRQALADAGLAAEAIGYINAHGTATPVGDVVETSAIRQMFGAHANTLCVSSTKAVHGHLLGAAGALEAVVTALAVSRGTVPPTAHLDHADPQCDLDYVSGRARRVPLEAAMSNSFGFGGMNAVLILEPFHA
jgi:3-oxoacyl-[acyl-carrier-protein] synthase II